MECKKLHFCPHCDHWQKKRHQCFAEPHGSNRKFHCNTAGPSQPKFHDSCGPIVPHAWPGFTKTALTHVITVGKAVVTSPRHAPHTQRKAVCPKKNYNYSATAYPEPWASQVGILVFNTHSTSDHSSSSSSTSISTSV